MAKLFIVSTPIGNMEDITLRALETLKSVDLILAEDTRQTKKLLNHYKIDKPLTSFHEHNEEVKADQITEKIKSGDKIALVSDAGTPLISDPGFKLVRQLLSNGVEVESIPGASSVITALTSSGLPPDQFLFIGYLPKKPGKIDQTLKFIETVTNQKETTIILFESPYRLEKTLKILAEKFPEKEVVVAREMTKVHEEFIRGKTVEVSKMKITAKGEVTLLLR